MALENEIAALKAERKAVVLAHNYCRPEVQDAADFTGRGPQFDLGVDRRRKLLAHTGGLLRLVVRREAGRCARERADACPRCGAHGGVDKAVAL